MHGRERLIATRLLFALAAASFLHAFATVGAQTAPPASDTSPAQAAPSVQSPDEPPNGQTGQAPPANSHPIAIVPLDSKISGYAAEVTGTLHVYNGRAFIDANGTITSGPLTTHVTLPYRGSLLVCTSTTIKLASDTSAPSGGMPGLLMALDHGAVEMSFANSPAGSNADILMTPDFRILVGGPGASEIKVRLGQGGDTCIDNSGKEAPYVVVTSLFDTGAYRVQPGQRVMLQHGSLHEVVDQEKEPCGCPPPPTKTIGNGNEFPLAQSEGLELPPPPPVPVATIPDQTSTLTQVVPPLVYSGNKPQEPAAVAAPAPPPAPPAPPQAAPPSTATQKKPGVFTRLGHFFRRVFGAE